MAKTWQGPFTSGNARFHTDIDQGYPHGTDQAKGSFFPHPIKLNADGYSLWPEYVSDSHGPGGWSPAPLWFMWYDAKGNPTITHSATFDISMIRDIVERFIV